jgi:carboxyl-terminal processing protease
MIFSSRLFASTSVASVLGFLCCSLSWAQPAPVRAPNSQIVSSDQYVAPIPAALEQSSEQSRVSTSEELLKYGMKLEQRRAWIDAIHHYEAALRRNPEFSQVRRRLQIARLHLDVVRRCADSSIGQLMREVTPAEALDLYSEITARLEMSYVEPVQYTELIRGGTAYLEVALTEPDFLTEYVSEADQVRVESFRRSIHQLTLARPVQSRTEARNLVVRAAEAARMEAGIHPTVSIFQFAFGAIALLDPYSAFLSPSELTEIESQIEGSFVGLGVALEPHVVPLRILNVIPGGPAREAGLRADDRILEVGAVRCSDVGAERAADLLRGPEGSQVRLLVQRPDGQLIDQIVGRRRVEVPSVEEAQLLDPDRKVGYVKISSFQKTTASEMDEALRRLHHQGMKSLIVDLRGNPGGWLDASVAVADRFLAEGAIVSTRGKNGIENHNYTARRSGTWQLPLAVLVDDQSASASEILAGAIRDNNRGKLIGCTTYGKGSVQGLFHTKSLNCGIRLTVSKFYSPSGRAISDSGVQPHIPLEKEAGSHLVAKPTAAYSQPLEDRALRIAVEEVATIGLTGFASTQPR